MGDESTPKTLHAAQDRRVVSVGFPPLAPDGPTGEPCGCSATGPGTRTNVHDREAVLGARALCQPRTHLWGVSLSSPITLAQASVHRFLGVGHGVWCGCRYHSSMRSPVHANFGSAWKVRSNRCHRGYQDRREGCTCGSFWTGPRGRSAWLSVARWATRWPAISSENGGDPRLWLQQGQGSRKGWRRTVGPRTSPGMSRMLCPRRGGGSVEVCTMKATSVAKRQCTGSAGTRRAARTGGGDDDAGGTDNQSEAIRTRWVQTSKRRCSASLAYSKSERMGAFSFVATSRGDDVACHCRENLSPQKNRWPLIVSLLVWQNGGRTHEHENAGRCRQLSRH